MSTEKMPAGIVALSDAMHKVKPFKNLSYGRAFEGFLNKIDVIADYYNVNKYKVVFIGEPGKGKTTSICNWLGLVKDNKEKSKGIGELLLLTTSSGRTTVAEVHIKQVNTPSRLRIEYMDINQQKEYIKDYCKHYYDKCFGIKDDVVETDDVCDVVDVHTEIDRVVRNMAHLIDPPSEGNEKLKEKRDRILEGMRKFENEEAFFQNMLAKINLESRTCPEIVYGGEIAYEDWLSATFRDVNDGRRADCSIASKIYVEVSADDINLMLPSYIEEVIDTIGLDSSVRTDLQDLMKAKNTICYMVDDLKNVPSPNIKNLIKNTYMTACDTYASLQTSIFVKSIDSELAEVNEADGDPEAGIEIKASELDRRVVADGIPYVVCNTLFKDSCAAFSFKKVKQSETDENGSIIINELTGKPKTKMVQVFEGYDEELAVDYRSTVTGKIDEIIARLKETLQKDAEEIRKEVDNLLELERNFENQEADVELLELKEKLVEVRRNWEPRFRSENIIAAILSKAVEETHPMTMKKLNKWHGGWNPRWKRDIYTQIMQVGKESFVSEIKDVNDSIREMLLEIDNNSARSIYRGYLNQLDIMVKNSVEKMGDDYLRWALNDCFAPQSDTNKFWMRVQAIKGTGYKKMVREQYKMLINEDGGMLAKKIKTEIEQILSKFLEMFPEN